VAAAALRLIGSGPISQRPPAFTHGALTVWEKMWDVRASKVAEFVRENARDVARGVLDLEEFDLVAAFGNDGFTQNPRVRREVNLIRQALPSFELTMLGFGLSSEDRASSWAMIIRGPDCFDALCDTNDLVWSSWANAAAKRRGTAPVSSRQWNIAWRALEKAEKSPTWAARFKEVMRSLEQARRYESLRFVRSQSPSREPEVARRVVTPCILSICPERGAARRSNPG
jgi:hypothetical protein